MALEKVAQEGLQRNICSTDPLVDNKTYYIQRKSLAHQTPSKLV